MDERGTGDAHAKIERLEGELAAERAGRARMQERLDDLEGKLAALLGYLPEQDVIEAVHRRGGEDALREAEDRPPPQRERGHLRRILGAVGLGALTTGLLHTLARSAKPLALSTTLSAAAAATYVLVPDVTSSPPAPLPVSSPAAGVPSVPLPAGPAGPGVPSLPAASLARPRAAASPSGSPAARPSLAASPASLPLPSPSDDAKVTGDPAPAGEGTPPVTTPPAVPQHGGKRAGRKVPSPSPTAVPSPVLPSFTPPAVPSPTWLPSTLRSLKDPDALTVV
jgi:hypothetical protein